MGGGLGKVEHQAQPNAEGREEGKARAAAAATTTTTTTTTAAADPVSIDSPPQPQKEEEEESNEMHNKKKSPPATTTTTTTSAPPLLVLPQVRGAFSATEEQLHEAQPAAANKTTRGRRSEDGKETEGGRASHKSSRSGHSHKKSGSPASRSPPRRSATREANDTPSLTNHLTPLATNTTNASTSANAPAAPPTLLDVENLNHRRPVSPPLPRSPRPQSPSPRQRMLDQAAQQQQRSPHEGQRSEDNSPRPDAHPHQDTNHLDAQNRAGGSIITDATAAATPSPLRQEEKESQNQKHHHHQQQEQKQNPLSPELVRATRSPSTPGEGRETLPPTPYVHAGGSHRDAAAAAAAGTPAPEEAAEEAEEGEQQSAEKQLPPPIHTSVLSATEDGTHHPTKLHDASHASGSRQDNSAAQAAAHTSEPRRSLFSAGDESTIPRTEHEYPSEQGDGAALLLADTTVATTTATTTLQEEEEGPHHTDDEDDGEPSPLSPLPHGAAAGAGGKKDQHQKEHGEEGGHSPTPSPPSADTTGHSFLQEVMAYRPVARSASPAAALGAYSDLTLHRVQQELQQRHKVFHVCLTGGPCAGKSTFLAQLQEKLPQRTGYHVMCVPEAATLLVTGGMQWDANLIVEQQLCLLRTQLALEDQFYALAVASGKPTVIVSDRGTMDGRAFCSEGQFRTILQQLGCTLEALRDRYDAVLHMVTAAYGAEAFYNLDNPARYEDLDGARASDTKLRRMYVGHPMFKLIDNSGPSFDAKIERGVQLICELVGHKASLQNTSYYVLRQRPTSLPAARARYEVTTTILSNSALDEIRLLTRRVMPDGSAMHFFRALRTSSGRSPRASMVRQGSQASLLALAGLGGDASGAGGGGRSKPATPLTQQLQQQQRQRIECDQRISSKEYASLLAHRDTTREDVVVDAVHFIFEDANYELCTIRSPSWAADKRTLMVETCRPAKTTTTTTKGEEKKKEAAKEEPEQEQEEAVCFPAFLEVDREIPTDIYTTYFLISHRETGPLYTALAFSPVFSRATTTVAALGPHADSMHLMDSVKCSPNAARTTPPRGAHRSSSSSLAGLQLNNTSNHHNHNDNTSHNGNRKNDNNCTSVNTSMSDMQVEGKSESASALISPKVDHRKHPNNKKQKKNNAEAATATSTANTTAVSTPEKPTSPIATTTNNNNHATAALLPHTPLRTLHTNTVNARPLGNLNTNIKNHADHDHNNTSTNLAAHGGPIRLSPLPTLTQAAPTTTTTTTSEHKTKPLLETAEKQPLTPPPQRTAARAEAEEEEGEEEGEHSWWEEQCASEATEDYHQHHHHFNDSSRHEEEEDEHNRSDAADRSKHTDHRNTNTTTSHTESPCQTNTSGSPQEQHTQLSDAVLLDPLPLEDIPYVPSVAAAAAAAKQQEQHDEKSRVEEEVEGENNGEEETRKIMKMVRAQRAALVSNDKENIYKS